jgi:secreted Zn-dependent insulinase-like peptidase
VSDYCSWLKASQQIYNELKDASAVSFQFKEKSPNYSYATDLSSTMHKIPLPEVISYRSDYAEFD